MDTPRGVTIFFNDGSKMVVEYPKQAKNDYEIVTRMNELLEHKHFLIEAGGAMLFIPVDNIKYLQVYPSPEKLPSYTIRGATIINS